MSAPNKHRRYTTRTLQKEELTLRYRAPLKEIWNQQRHMD